MSNDEGKPRRRLRKRLLKTGVGLVVLALLSFLGVECWRQWDISQARAEADEAIVQAVEPFADVHDWPNWYHNRVDGTWGGSEYRKWTKSIYDGDTPFLDLEVEDALEEHLAGVEEPSYPEPDRDVLIAYLASTQDAVDRSGPLLAFDTLSGIPEFDEDKLPTLAVLPQLGAFKLLRNRVYMLTWLNRYEEAWRELERLYQLSSRMQQASTHAEYLVHIAIENYTHTALEHVCLRSTPPSDVAELFPMHEPPDQSIRLAEGELAWWAQCFNVLEPDNDADDWEYDGEGWFAWVFWNDEDTNEPYEYLFSDGDRDIFSNAALKYRHVAQSARNALEIYEAAKAGRKPILSQSYSGGIWIQPISGRARLWVIRQRANLLVELRRAEAQGVPVAEFQLDKKRYPDLELNPTAEGVEVRYAKTQTVFDAQQLEDWTEFNPVPVTLIPLD